MRNYPVLYWATIASLFLLLLSVAFSFNFNAYFTQAQMMPSTMPTQPTASSTPSNNQTILILAVIATVVSIIVIISILLIVFVRKQKRRTSHVYTSIDNPSTPAVQPAKTPSKQFQAFLCYKKSSGKDYADHLKAGLEEVGLHTFEDCKDIPLTVETEEGWAKIRDQALTESKYFLLIMTPGFDRSSEVIKELKMAIKQPNKVYIFFRHRSMGRKIVVNLNDEVLDIGQLEQVSFESKEELLRLAINILFKGGNP
jgi:hypothetical protein